MQTFEEIEPTVFVLVWLFFKAMSFKWKVMSLCFLTKEIVLKLLSSIQYINNQQLFILKLTNNFSYWSWDKAHHTIKSHRGKSPCRHLDLKKFRFLEHSISFCPTFCLGTWDFKTPTPGRGKTKTNSFQNPNVIKHTVHERKKNEERLCFTGLPGPLPWLSTPYQPAPLPMNSNHRFFMKSSEDLCLKAGLNQTCNIFSTLRNKFSLSYT